MPVVVRLLHLARPKGAWLIGCLPLFGFGYGLWERGSTVHPWVVAPTIALLFTAWLLGHAGSLWLNAVLDRDGGAVLLGRAVPVPAIAGPAGYLALGLSIATAGALGPVVGGCSLACAALAILYSHPKVAWKGSALGGPFVNAVGYGVLSPLAGWWASEAPLTWRAVVTLALTVSFMLGLYFAAQAFQGAEDRERGYRTLVVTHGPRWTLRVARLLIGVAVVALLTLSALGVYPRALLVSLPAWIWTHRHLARWAALPSGGTGRHAGQLVGRLSVGVLLVLFAVYAAHFGGMALGAPPGGCGTAIVPDAAGCRIASSGHAPG